ncbi:MAG TPA: di-heme oxidoredictase family protein [Pirellulales bacterium]|nr:di-heme oxidoredictase family protein [Pirellulales bacterium]
MRRFIRVNVSQGSFSTGSFSRGRFSRGRFSRDRFSRGSAARLGRLIVVIGILPGAFVPTSRPAAGQAPGRQVNQPPGQELFTREWQPGDRLSDAGDALGPMYNEVSCAKCHRLGGIGGAGPNENNVDLLTIERPERTLTNAQKERFGFETPACSTLTNAQMKRFRERVHALHPGFHAQAGQAASVVLHRFGTDDGYAFFRDNLLRTKERRTQPASNGVIKHRYASLRHTQRNSTALFGAGLIDTVPAAALEEAALQQARKGGGVSGRVPLSNQGGPGRFGWRGQTATLRDFVLTACAMEVGLEVPGHHQAVDPFDPERAPRGLDLNAEQCDQLVAFVAKLSAPTRFEPAERQAAADVQAGETTFEAIGCAVCHCRQMGPVTGIYSDLLLHDMGPALADPVPAVSEQSPAGGGYFGGAVDLFARVNTVVHQELLQDWRTPPLWGVHDSAPYLHDGRAATMDDAIRLHGGEANTSLQNYNELPQRQRTQVIAFLNCLVAPGGP